MYLILDDTYNHLKAVTFFEFLVPRGSCLRREMRTSELYLQVRNWSELNQPDDRQKDLNVPGMFNATTKVNTPVRIWPMQDMPTRLNERHPIPYDMKGVAKTDRALADWELGKLAHDLSQMYKPTMDEWGSDDEEYQAHPPVPNVNFSKSPKIHRRAGCWE